MRIPLDFYEQLRNRIKLSEVIRQKISLTKKSGEYVGLCPFHTEKSPSFTVSDKKMFYHCFGCGAHGDVIKFVSNLNGLPYKDSAIKLASEYGIELPRLTKEQEKIYEESDQIFSILEIATEFFKTQLKSDTLNYLNQRGVDQQTIEKFDIGFAPSGGKLQNYLESRAIPLMNIIKSGLMGKNDEGRIYEIFHDRIIFPIRNIYNKVVGFGGRIIGDGQPKYINSPETIIFKKKEILYGENKAITAAYKKNYSILVEGYLDVIALHKVGFEEAVASLGTAVTESHLQKLWRAGDEIILCLDGDQAGVKASKKVINLILPIITTEKRISFILLPKGKDPDDIISNEGAEFFQNLINQRINLSEMIWHIEYANRTFISAESKAELEASLENYCDQIKERTLSINYRRFFKDQIWQSLIKRNNKINKNFNLALSSQITEGYNYTDIEILQHALCSILVKFPEIVEEEEVKDFLLTIDFKNLNLAAFRDWFFNDLINNDNFLKKNLEELVKNTSFYDTFLLLIKPDNLYLNTAFNKNIDPKLLWQLLHKKYYLAILKEEYALIIQNSSDDTFKKAILYQEEILKTSKELQKINESFINY